MVKGFPLSFFPDTFVPVLQEVAYCNRFNMDYLSASVLSVAATAIGNSHSIVVKDSWIERPSLWIALVGVPGVAKSHPLSWAMDPLNRREKKLFKEFKERLKEWHQDPDKDNIPQPDLVKIVCGDVTPEAVSDKLSKNDRGILIYNDELSGWLNSFQRYNKGNDEQFYLTVWSGKPWIVDRKTSIPIRIDEPVVNISGTIQPSVLDRIFKDKEESGFTDRWLICHPDGVKKEYWTDDVVSYGTTESYHQLIYNLLDLSMSRSESDDPTSNKIPYSPEANAIIHAWHRNNTDEINKTDSEPLKAVRAKMEVYIHRFALVSCMIDFAWSNGFGSPLFIGAAHASAACELADYFLGNMMRMREGGKADSLPQQWREIYDMLPDYEQEFKKIDFIGLTNQFEIEEKTASKWLEKNNGKLFKRVKYGVYCKI